MNTGTIPQLTPSLTFSPNQKRRCKASKTVFVGKPGTGKTTEIKRIVLRALEDGRRVLVVTPHENEWTDLPLIESKSLHHIKAFNGGKRILVRDSKEFYKVCEYFRNGLLVCDDSCAYIPYDPDPVIWTMLTTCRIVDRELIAVYHGFTMVPPLFFTNDTHFAVFSTIDKVSFQKNSAINFPALEATVNHVNREAVKNPHFFKIIKNNNQ